MIKSTTKYEARLDKESIRDAILFWLANENFETPFKNEMAEIELDLDGDEMAIVVRWEVKNRDD